MARNSDEASSTDNSKNTLGESISSRDLRPQDGWSRLLKLSETTPNHLQLWLIQGAFRTPLYRQFELGSLTGPIPFLCPEQLQLLRQLGFRENYRIILTSVLEHVRTILTVSAEVVSKETPEIIEFNQLRGRTTAEALSELVDEFGTVYVTALTRQGCSGCETQKPLYKTLAERITQENPGKVRFRRLHVNYEGGDKRESWTSKRVFGHAAYPTYTIHVKSHVGPLEIYRSIYPPMEELGKQIKDSFELAEFYKTEAQAASDQTLKISES